MPRIVAATDPWIRWDWVERHRDDIVEATRDHLELTAIAVGAGLMLSIPLALAARRWPRLNGPILGFTGFLYTIPSLALFAFFVPITGLSRTTAEIGLISYTLLILVRNMVVGLAAVPDEVLDAADGMGYRPTNRLLKVEIPLALPAIIAGLRLATVTTIGLVTVTALIGEGGLGRFIQDGFARDFKTPLVVGLGLSVVLAVAAEVSLVILEKLVTPWARR